MSQRLYILLAAGGSAALLSGAFLFQWAGYPPCTMCLWQRWPHVAAILIGIVALIMPARILCFLGAFAAAITAGIGIFHTGVERDWWEGPSTCTGTGGLGPINGADLLSTDGPRVVMCDQVSWEFLTLSMASWNAVLSIIVMILWLTAGRQKQARL